jgi:hypothetical protein
MRAKLSRVRRSSPNSIVLLELRLEMLLRGINCRQPQTKRHQLFVIGYLSTKAILPDMWLAFTSI